ncbi:MAG TPA: hypothetical protein VJT67_09250 [Longimicrobiaceae bacterium]|nr:hypothetical protein [Longimicrobiaceae bacterium]
MKPRHTILLCLLGATVASGIWLLRGLAPWDDLEKASAFLVNLTILAGATAAIVKFQLYNLLGHRWRSDLSCRHYDLPDGSVVFTADYTITNTGERPLVLSDVHVQLYASRTEGVLLKPDKEKCLAERWMVVSDSTLKGLFQVEPGERSIFTLRCRLPRLDEVVFIECGFVIPQRRVPAAFSGLYVKAGAEKPAVSTEPGQPRISLPAMFGARDHAINPS